ncbi:hypothetical protein EDE09_1463 [Neorhizobium sp. S3-V5DH]|nr:hypothetical protein EDE09_1463 [Neorhizobium sp. S3-V5DH]
MTDDWQADLRLGLEHLVDKAVVKGAKQNDVFAAVGANSHASGVRTTVTRTRQKTPLRKS